MKISDEALAAAFCGIEQFVPLSALTEQVGQ